MKTEYSKILEKYKDIYPVPVENIAKDFGYEVKYFKPKTQETEQISGMIDYKEKIIYINNLDPLYRQRFILARQIIDISNGDICNISDDELFVYYQEDIYDNFETSKYKKSEIFSGLGHIIGLSIHLLLNINLIGLYAFCLLSLLPPISFAIAGYFNKDRAFIIGQFGWIVIALIGIFNNL